MAAGKKCILDEWGLLKKEDPFKLESEHWVNVSA